MPKELAEEGTILLVLVQLGNATLGFGVDSVSTAARVPDPVLRSRCLGFVAAVAVFAGSLWLVRSQATVDQVSWMKAMIPHHSIAITSERAHISDPRVRALADGIIKTQRKEIDEMKALIQDLERK